MNNNAEEIEVLTFVSDLDRLMDDGCSLICHAKDSYSISICFRDVHCHAAYATPHFATSFTLVVHFKCKRKAVELFVGDSLIYFAEIKEINKKEIKDAVIELCTLVLKNTEYQFNLLNNCLLKRDPADTIEHGTVIKKMSDQSIMAALRKERTVNLLANCLINTINTMN